MNPNDPAYPRTEGNTTYGLTKREAIAAIAMHGILASCGVVDAKHSSYIATIAIANADALIAALGKEQP